MHVHRVPEFLLGTVKMKKIFVLNIGMWGVNPEDFIWQVGAVKSEIDLDSR